MAHDWNEMVSITLPKNGDLVTKVTVNGRTYEIERGKPTEVPYPVYERLQLMLAWDQTPPVQVPQSSDGGIKTAIFKQVGYDETMADPDGDYYQTAYVCDNMTRDEAIQTIMSGQPLDVIYMAYGDNRGFRTHRDYGEGIGYNPDTNVLFVGESWLWGENNKIVDANPPT